MLLMCVVSFFFKHKTAYERRISDWSSDVCSSDLTVWLLFEAGNDRAAYGRQLRFGPRQSRGLRLDCCSFETRFGGCNPHHFTWQDLSWGGAPGVAPAVIILVLVVPCLGGHRCSHSQHIIPAPVAF